MPGKRYLLLPNLVLRTTVWISDYNLLYMSRKTRLKDTKYVVPGNISCIRPSLILTMNYLTSVTGLQKPLTKVTHQWNLSDISLQNLLSFLDPSSQSMANTQAPISHLQHLSLSSQIQLFAFDSNSFINLQLSPSAQTSFSSVQFSRSVMSDSLRPHEL